MNNGVWIVVWEYKTKIMRERERDFQKHVLVNQFIKWQNLGTVL